MVKKTLKVLLVTAVVFGGLEVAARIHYRGRFPYHLIFDDRVLWRHRPGWSGKHRGEVDCTFNALGLRDSREVTSPKPASVRRVLLVGDSIAFGYELEADQTIARHLEARWTSPPNRPEVWNAGVCGFATEQQTILLDELAPAVEPDVVVLLVCMNNDVATESLADHRARSGARHPGQRAAAAGGGAVRFLIERSALAFAAARFVERRRTDDARRNHEGTAFRFTKLEDFVAWDDEKRAATYATFESRLAAFKQVVDRAGARAILAVCPEAEQVSGAVSAEPIAAIDAMARRLGFVTVDVLAAYRDAARPVLMDDGTHPNAQGAAVIAARLEPAIRRLLDVPRP